MKSQTKKLGQRLIEHGWVSGEQLLRAIQSQRAVGGRLGTCLLEMDAISEEHLLDILSEQLGVPAVRIEKLKTIDSNILDLVPSKVALRCEAVPFGADEEFVDIATLHVHNLSYLDELKFCTNLKIRPHIVNEARLFEALEKYYGFECPRRYGHLLDRLNRARYLWGNGSGEPTSTLDAAAELATPSSSVEWRDPDEAFDELEVVRPPSAYSVHGMSPTAAARALAEQRLNEAKKAAKATVGGGSNGRLTLDELDRQLALHNDLREIGTLLLAYLAERFTRAALFRVRPQQVLGWMARGDGIDQKLFRAVWIDFQQPSIFLNLRQGARFHLGPLLPMPAHLQLVRCWGGEWPAASMAVPVSVQGRMTAVLYGDRGPVDLTDFHLDEFTALASKAAEAFELCILRKKLQHG